MVRSLEPETEHQRGSAGAIARCELRSRRPQPARWFSLRCSIRGIITAMAADKLRGRVNCSRFTSSLPRRSELRVDAELFD